MIGQMHHKKAMTFIEKEIQELGEKKSSVQRVVMAIKARDSCIKKIEELSGKEFSNGQTVTQDKLD